MVERLRQIIREKAFGSQKEFCAMLGWSPQYLNGLLKNGGMGMTPYRTILEKFPDIDARWLLFGTGSMYGGADSEKETRLQTFNRIEQIITLEKFIPVFTDEENSMYSELLLRGTLCKFSDEQMDSLKERLKAYAEPQETLLKQSMKESVCRKRK